MRFVFYILIFQVFYGLAKCNISQINSLDFSQQEENFNTDIYLYIPFNSFQIYENSLGIYNENGILLDHLNVKTLKEKLGLQWDQAFLLTIKHVKDNIFVLPLIQYSKYVQDGTASVYYIFIDEYFKFRYKFNLFILYNI